MSIKALSKEEFNNKDVIYFSNILDGFNNYNYFHFSPNNMNYEEVEKNYIKLIEDLFYLNDSVLIDFYKNKLDEKSIKFIEKNIEEKEISLLKELINCGEKDSEFFEISDISYIPLLIKLNLKELFFITFYFEKLKATLWGNYNYKFPLFIENEEIGKKYKKIAEQYSLL